MVNNMKTYAWITSGGVIQGMAMALFLFPHSIPSGGAGGLAVLLNYWFDIPLGFALWIVNFSLLVVAIYWLGNSSAIGTMYAITITSASIYIANLYLIKPMLHPLLDLILGSVILGLGVGILLKQGVSNGGMGVLALIFAKYRQIRPGKPLFWLNGCIFIITGFIIDWRIIVQAVFSQWLSTRVVDFIFTYSIKELGAGLIGIRKK